MGNFGLLLCEVVSVLLLLNEFYYVYMKIVVVNFEFDVGGCVWIEVLGIEVDLVVVVCGG